MNPQNGNPAGKVVEIAGREPDIVFECVGVKSTLAAATEMVAPRGRVVVLGVCMEPDQIMPMICVLKEIVIEFALGYSRAEFEETLVALSSGHIDARPMITDTIGVDEVPAMFDALRKPTKQAKVLVEFPH